MNNENPNPISKTRKLPWQRQALDNPIQGTVQYTCESHPRLLQTNYLLSLQPTPWSTLIIVQQTIILGRLALPSIPTKSNSDKTHKLGYNVTQDLLTGHVGSCLQNKVDKQMRVTIEKGETKILVG